MAKNNTNYKPRIYVLLILALGGLGITISLTNLFYSLRSGAAGFKSFCNISETLNCDTVTSSQYAELFAGIPVSSFGAGWYVAIFIAGLMALSLAWRRQAAQALLGLTGVAAVASVYYFLIMAVKIKTYCIMCLFGHGIDLALFGIALSLRGSFQEKEPIAAGSWKTFAGITLGSVVLAVLFLKSLDAAPIDSATIDMTVQHVLNTPVVAVNSGDEFPSMGPKNAPVTVVEFIDFQCPSCRIGASIMHAIRSKYPDTVRLVVRNYPLDPKCNPDMTHGGHPYSCEAAGVAVCSNRQGKFAQVFEELFQNQKDLAPGVPAKLAQQVGVDLGQLQMCVSSPDPGTAIAKDLEEGKRLGVQSTPTFFINGRKVEGTYPIPMWDQLISKLAATQ